MGFYTLNRAAINAGVAGFIAGAAMLASTSTVEASATRVVLPEASVALVSNFQATGTRNVFGGAGFVTEFGGSAFPALLQLEYADIHSSSAFKATYTEAWFNQTFQFDSNGTVIRPGSGVMASVLEISAEPLVDVGFTSTVYCSSFATADASVQRSGQSTIERDGYATQAFTSSLVADGLRTALVYATSDTAFSLVVDAIKTHGGAADMVGKLAISAIASTDRAQSNFLSDMVARPTHIHAGESLGVSSGYVYADPVAIIPGSAQEMVGISEVTAAGRLALLGQADLVGSGVLDAAGTRVHLGYSTLAGLSDASAQWALLIDGEAVVVCSSDMSALPYTNAEAPDPESRTMRRVAVDRVIRRPYVNRVMRRQA